MKTKAIQGAPTLVMCDCGATYGCCEWCEHREKHEEIRDCTEMGAHKCYPWIQYPKEFIYAQCKAVSDV